jgi:predicted phosphodiesterase
MMFFPSILVLLATSVKVKNHIRTDHLLLQQVRRDSNSVVWVDVENVRGKSGFELTHDQALRKTVAWTKFHNLMGKVIFVVDHGSVKEAYNHDDGVMSIVFAGPSEKADDVIAYGVPYFDRSVVITADTGLQQRCRRGAAKNRMHIMSPAKFLDDLELVGPLISSTTEGQPLDDEGETDEEGESADDGPPLSLEQQVKLGKLDEEIRLRGQILDAEIQMHKKKTMTKKRRKKLQDRIDKVRQKLALKGPSLLEEITSIETSSSSSSDKDDLDPLQKGLLLSRWREIQNRAPRREQTGDRVVYAEQLRRQIMENAGPEGDIDADDDSSPAQSFLMHINGISKMPLVRPTVTVNAKGVMKKSVKLESKSEILPNDSTFALMKNSSGVPIDSLTIVAVSDTHGLEGQLIVDPESRSDILPDGDLLLHLGDFARDGSRETQQNGVLEFDSWLAKQPHKYKIVVRGNHDPWSCEFSQSGAWYITKPATAMIGGFELAMIPHGSARTLTASGGLPSSCDILATHVPPYKTLDRTFTGKHAGSQFLTKTVRNMGDKAPRLWLCGHIHEGRGITKRRFGSRETLVVNAANANEGRASHLEHGPVVIRLESDKEKDAELVSMESKMMEKVLESGDFFGDNSSSEDVNDLLLSVDLGLKSGIALFTNDGSLVRYEQFLFQRETLQADAQKLIKEWEDEANEEMSGEEKQSKITHIAIEGADTLILKYWTEAAPQMSILRVSPEEWRSEMLTNKEKASGSDSKAAARLIARQVVSDFGTMDQHKGKFPTDVAEAVVMGSYVAGKLGWITRNPLVRRYTNGNVVVPKKA